MKFNSKIQLNDPESPTISPKHKSIGARVQTNSISLLMSNIKSVEIIEQPLSPIKTNGFCNPNKALNRINNSVQFAKFPFTQEKSPMRNFTARRQQLRKPIPN